MPLDWPATIARAIPSCAHGSVGGPLFACFTSAFFFLPLSCRHRHSSITFPDPAWLTASTRQSRLIPNHITRCWVDPPSHNNRSAARSLRHGKYRSTHGQASLRQARRSLLTPVVEGCQSHRFGPRLVTGRKNVAGRQTIKRGPAVTMLRTPKSSAMRETAVGSFHILHLVPCRLELHYQ